MTLEVIPTIEPDGQVIDLSLTWTLTNFDGYVDADGKPVPVKKGGSVVQFPVFDTHTVSTVATLSSGATIVFGRDEEHLFARKSIRSAQGGAGHDDPPESDEERLLLVFVTATLVNPAGTGGIEGHLSATTAPGIDTTDQPLSQPMGSPASFPPGVPVPGKPGFVTSPYAPDAGYVDLRGYTRGQAVRDPYTGKMFLVP